MLQPRRLSSDFSYNYSLVLAAMPAVAQRSFIQNETDEETREFLAISAERSNSVCRTFTNTLFQTLMLPFFSVTATNGFLSRGKKKNEIKIEERKMKKKEKRDCFYSSVSCLKLGRMFVLSQAQVSTHLIMAGAVPPLRSLLDIGAGDGHVTRCFAPNFERVFATEACPIMTWRLRQRGYAVLGINGWEDQKYDVISCLNVLDRCDRPLSLLRKMRDCLVPGSGRLFIALVLPYSPFVESGARKLEPTERLNITGRTIEANITSLIENVFTPLGLQLEVLFFFFV
jgi:SAM-dependent methyltransferase